MVKKSMNMNDLPCHMNPADAELFDSELRDFGEMEVSGQSLDRILSSTMRKAGFEMNDTAMNGTSIINVKEKRDNNTETENTLPTPTARVRRSGVLAACFALIFVGIGAAVLFGANKISTLPAGNTPGSAPGAAVTETSSDEEDGTGSPTEEGHEEDQTTVPDLMGMTVPEAIDAVKRADLTYVLKYTFSDKVEKGRVAGQAYATGTAIEIFVSMGSRESAENYLRDKGLYERARQLEQIKEKIEISFADKIAEFTEYFGFEPKLPDLYERYAERGEITAAYLDILDSEYESLLNTDPDHFLDFLCQYNQQEIIEKSHDEDPAVTTVTQNDTLSARNGDTRPLRMNQLSEEIREKHKNELARFEAEYGFYPVLYSDEVESLDEIENMLGKILDMSPEEFYAHLEQVNELYIVKSKATAAMLAEAPETAVTSVRGTYDNDDSEEPVEMTLFIEFPDDVEGSYTFDIYRDGKAAYTKTINCVEKTKGNEAVFDVLGIGKETLVVYVKKNDVAENYIKYGTIEVDYDTRNVLYGDLDKEAFNTIAALR